MENLSNTIKKAFANYWQAILEAFPRLVIGLVLFTIILIIAFAVRRLIRRKLAHRITDVLLRNFIARTTFIVIVLIGIIVFMGRLGWGQAAGGLLAGAGVSALVIGFAFKDIGENFLAGFFLAFSRPFSIGDTIKITGTTGKVSQLNFRSTHLRTFDGKDVFIPNGILIKEKLENYTRDGLIRHDFSLGIDYGSDVSMAIQDILDTLATFDDIDTLSGRTPYVLINDFGTSTINLSVYFWTNTATYKGSTGQLKTAIMAGVLTSLNEKGYGMPADILELKIYDDQKPIPVNVRPQQQAVHHENAKNL